MAKCHESKSDNIRIDEKSYLKRRGYKSSESNDVPRKKKKKVSSESEDSDESSSSSSSSSSSISSTSSSSSSHDSKKRKSKKSRKKQRKKDKKLKQKEKMRKKKLKAKQRMKKKDEKSLSKSKEETSDDIVGPIPLPNAQEIPERSRLMAPMTKEEWEKRQSVVRKVYDEATGRHRLVKGDGEVIEEIVSKQRHQEINRQATQGDGMSFQNELASRLYHKNHKLM